MLHEDAAACLSAAEDGARSVGGQPDRLLEQRQHGGVRRNLLRRRLMGTGGPRRADDHERGPVGTELGDEIETGLTAADQLEIDRGKQLAVEQGAVLGACREIDLEPAA